MATYQGVLRTNHSISPHLFCSFRNADFILLLDHICLKEDGIGVRKNECQKESRRIVLKRGR